MNEDIKSEITEFYFKNKDINENKIPEDVLFILKKLKDSGFLTFLVGGCIRDLLLGWPVRDWDIITDAKPKQIRVVFSKYKTMLIGKSSQTVTTIINHKAYQISTIRNSSYHGKFNNLDGPYKILTNDLICRDFTINSICWNQDIGLIDPINGIRDLNNKILHSPNPDLRFKEDPLRMLRAVRIACELSFRISLQVKKSIHKNAFLIQFVSPERIKREIISILDSPDLKQGMSLLYKFGLERYILSLDKVKKVQFNKKVKNKLKLSGLKILDKDLASKLAFWGRLHYGSCKTATLFYFPVIECLRFKKTIIETVRIVLSREWQKINFSSDINIRLILAQVGKENSWRIFLLKKALLIEQNKTAQLEFSKLEEKLLKEEINKKPPLRISELTINGDDLIKMGLPEGEKIGEILDIILKKVLIKPYFNQKKYLSKFVQNIINQ